MNMKCALMAIAALTLASPAFAADEETYQNSTKIKKDAEGNYVEKDKTTETDASGTKTTYEKQAKVKVKNNGDIDKSTTTEKTVKPKGFHRKHTVKTANKQKTKDGQTTGSQKVTVDGKTVEDTKENSQQ